MKAICIKNKREVTTAFKDEIRIEGFDLTIGKVYEILELREYSTGILPRKCSLIDDFGFFRHINYDFFIPLDESRNQKIEEILK